MNSDNKKINELIKEISLNKSEEFEYYNFGVKYFGPFLYGFTEWLLDSIRKNGCEKVFFFSRDGYMMEKAFNECIERNELEVSYVYFSRKSIRQSLLHYFATYEESLKYLTWERFLSIGKILEYFGLSQFERERIADLEGINLQQDIAFEEIMCSPFLKNIYNRYKNLIDKNSIEQDILLEKYLNQMNMKGKCAIVDIGWHGSMQYFLEEFYIKHSISINLCGFYVGILPNVPIQGSVNGYLYCPDRPEMRKSALCFFGGYEKLFQSCEGSTYGYSYNHYQKISPVLADYEYEKDTEFINNIKDWQKGALDFVNMALSRNIHCDNVIRWSKPLVEFGKNPSLDEIKLFHNLYNMDGSKIYYISQKPIYKYTPKELIHALSNSVWKTGFMKSVFKIPFPYFWIYCLIRK